MGSSGTGGGSAAGGNSLASIGLSAYSTILQSQGVANADEYQAQKLETAATYGDLKAVQTGAQMTRSLTTTLGNIAAVRAAANTDPTSPTGVAVTDNQEAIGESQRGIAVNSILQQSRQDRNDAAYYKDAADNALLAGGIGAAAGIAKGIAGKFTGGLFGG
ncbi:hypothetical protein [Bradyrhizobium lablabi]|uniref:Uncharacterized protein n=1 Tax=Bradyrhizobium lablabi TaxID=722472 RepID=A0A1H5JHI4_9BRAD|nr:hypothetical protein [Bradyrhizobium lablabi]SEE51976.1 hypothetical protein SAMN05444171_7830 [Bradyrhizobium lablabi]